MPGEMVWRQKKMTGLVQQLLDCADLTQGRSET